jgi:5-methylcytosine-specific restriction protein A
MPKRPCLEPNCGQLTTRTRCPTHEQQYQARRNVARGDRYGTDYRKQRAALLATHPPCHWCGAAATTADHVEDGLVPACGPCNSSRGGKAERRR